ncbi:isoprenoid biosynthesis enzyme family protein [Granulicella tundricola]|uniref:SpoVT-AbrB domain-containing protein n=1 Tax=Granulicella tundricola (strain ATCC BAA-1859 / DSM 23138 / MP5ACTX9) TaxID=1198114 RepID=E8WW80_GRATM|nr:hypothetical protein [Granulicella tundricola]ADW68463.1 hypothetical protein AciX9_1405 [Granulicella tundricola MP5ACTX9]
MTYIATVDHEGQIKLPQEILEHLGVSANVQVELEATEGAVKVSRRLAGEATMSLENRLKRAKDAIEKYGGPVREQFLAEGWKSVDEYIDDMRGR